MIDSCVKITLDVRETSAPVVVKAKRSDTGRRILISLADGGMPYTISEDCFATFTGRKADKTTINNACAIANNVIEYVFTEQTCAAVGRMSAEIRLYGSGGKLLTSASFILEVHDSVWHEGDPVSEDEMTALDALILETTALKHEVEQKLANGEFVGEQGPQGEIGPQGPRGEAGPQGEKGERGAQGPVGPQGEQGEVGPTGPRGAQGIQGERGVQGEVGPQGAIGPQGERGLQGEQGPRGIQGDRGPEGPAGKTPERGVDYWTDADKQEIVDDVLTQIPPFLVNTASGSLISLSDATDLKLRGLKLFGKTTQDGTPSPDAPVPLVSAGDGGSLGVTVAGKNLLKNMLVSGSQNGVTWEVGTDGSITISGTATGANVFVNILKNQKENIAIKMFDGKVIPNTASRTQTTIDGKKVTLSEDLNIDGVNGNVYYKISSGMTVNKTYYPQIEFGSIATAFEPYKEPQPLTFSTPNGLPGIPVTSGGNYTDETGQQWVCDEVDFARGVYVQRIGVANVRSVSDVYTIGTSNVVYYAVYRPTQKAVPYSQTLTTHLSSSTSSITAGKVTVSSVGNLSIAHADQTINTAELWNAWLTAQTEAGTPLIINYQLATPIETPLSAEELAAYAALHTNYPNTTILNDGGAGMEVSYVADTKLYIDNKINAMAAAIVNA